MNVTEPRSAPDGTSDMVAANEALVLAALRAMQQADEAVLARFEAERRGGLDSLTQIPGRAQTLEALAHAVAQARRSSTPLAVLFLDLDNFKRINDVHGHRAGDEVLKASSARMKKVLREADFVGRYGGDEFVALLTDVAHPADAVPIADKLIAALDEPLRVGSHVLRMSPSIGIAMFPGDATASEELLARADAAMYFAKGRGSGRYAFSHEARGVHANALRASWEASLSHAASDGGSVLQRKAELRSRAALLRVLRTHGALPGIRQSERLLRQALCRGRRAGSPSSRVTLGLSGAVPQHRVDTVAARMTLLHLVCTSRGQHLLRSSRRFRKAPSRVSSRHGCALCAALLGDFMGPAHGEPCMARWPVRPQSPAAA